MLKKLVLSLKWFARYWWTFVWMGVISALTWLVWRTTKGLIGSAWIVLPPVKIIFFTTGDWKLPPLPFYPAFTFAYAAILARPPALRHPAESWVFRLWVVPLREWKKNLIRGRLPLVDWGFRKVGMNWFRRGWRRTHLCLAVGVFIVCIYDLPKLKQLLVGPFEQDFNAILAYDPPVSTRVYSADGEEICRFTLEDREVVPISRVPLYVQQAFVAAEDQNFYSHDGIDPIAILRAAKENHESGHVRQGGSTISQQVVKQLILHSSERSVERKLRELFLVVDLEKTASKDKILEVYLNHIYLGRAYGIQAAAESYFGKDVGDLTLAEAAFLAGMPKAPSAYSPSVNYDRAKRRQAYVLGRMRDQGFITEAQRQAALAEDVAVIESPHQLNRIAAPYACEEIRKELEQVYGKDAVYRRGLTVQTTIDMRMQRAAEASVRNGLLALERDLGFSGPEGHDDAFTGACAAPGDAVADDALEMAQVVSDDAKGVSVCIRGSLFPMQADDVRRIREWEGKSGRRLAAGDTLTVQVRTSEERVSKKETRQVRYAFTAQRTAGASRDDVLQAALVAVDPKTGYLKALVGGYDFNENQFDMATQSRRQTGSSIKPYIYLTALMKGTVVTDVLVDAPRCYPSASGTWCPKNYLGQHTSQQYMGAVDLRTALAQSLNSISVQLLDQAGIENGIRTMRALGITSRIDRVLPIAIGSVEVSLWEHTYAYATIAAEGRRMPHQFGNASAGVVILKVTDADGQVLYAYDPPPPEQAVPADAAYAMIYLMKGVVQFGTGRRVQELGRPAAGKTGTTNGFKDAWFMGFTPDLVTGVWVGRQDLHVSLPIGRDEHDERTGGSTALPLIWLPFMKVALAGTPPREFPVPADVALFPGPDGKPIPFQRGRVPDKFLAVNPAPF